jgi:tRNA A-37 threonylcarbamoyl transferase component Bud32
VTAGQTIEFVDAVLDAVTAVAHGGAGGVPALVERALARSIRCCSPSWPRRWASSGTAGRVGQIVQAMATPVGRTTDTVTDEIDTLRARACPFVDLPGERPIAMVWNGKTTYRDEAPVRWAGMDLIATGRDADVYALGEDRVLRRYRDGGDVAREAEVMVHLAGHGYPVPAVHEAAGADIVMARLNGPTMLRALRTGAIDALTAGRTLADLHNQLRRIPARLSPDPAVRVLHMDLHPDNVILGARGPVVIDWRNTREGAPALDAAMSALILAQLAVANELVRPALAAFLHSVDGVTRLDDALEIRRADKNLTSQEVEDLALAVSLVRGSPGGWVTPAGAGPS